MSTYQKSFKMFPLDSITTSQKTFKLVSTGAWRYSLVLVMDLQQIYGVLPAWYDFLGMIFTCFV